MKSKYFRPIMTSSPQKLFDYDSVTLYINRNSIWGLARYPASRFPGYSKAKNRIFDKIKVFPIVYIFG